jgi:hypothetical protein
MALAALRREGPGGPGEAPARDEGGRLVTPEARSAANARARVGPGARAVAILRRVPAIAGRVGADAEPSEVLAAALQACALGSVAWEDLELVLFCAQGLAAQLRLGAGLERRAW